MEIASETSHWPLRRVKFTIGYCITSTSSDPWMPKFGWSSIRALSQAVRLLVLVYIVVEDPRSYLSIILSSISRIKSY